MESTLERESALRAAHPGANGASRAGGSLDDAPGRVRIVLVPVEVVGEFVDEVEGWLASAFERTVWVDRPVQRVREGLASGVYRLMLGGLGEEVLGAAVVEAVALDGRGVLFVVAAGGVKNEVFEVVGPDMWRALVAYARAAGLASVVTVGRPGWFRWVRREHVGGVVRMRQVLVEAEV